MDRRPNRTISNRSPTRSPVQLEQLRGAARSAAAPHQEERGEHLRHSDRAHHAAVSRRRSTLMQELNLDVAGEFLVMAATLIHIKSKMLLPRPRRRRASRARRKIRATRWCGACSSIRSSRPPPSCCTSASSCASAQWQRPDERVAAIAGDDYEPELEVDLFSLLTAFQAVVQRAKQRPKVLLPPEQMPVEVRIEQLLARLSETEACGFEDLFADVARPRRPHRHVSGAARDDSTEAGARVPGGQLRPDSRLQARAAGRCAASDWRSGDDIMDDRRSDGQDEPTGRRRRKGRKGRRAATPRRARPPSSRRSSRR